jgi:hypothetical protein
MKTAIGKTMPYQLKQFYLIELAEAKKLIGNHYYAEGWQHLERAHVLGQPYAIEHTVVHWKMICFGFKIKNTKEVIGQIPRLLFGGVKSFVGKVPIGNTGGANVPALKQMQIPQDLQLIIEKCK